MANGVSKIVESGKLTQSQYRTLHQWVERRLGKPKSCTNCSLDDITKNYDWANVSGEYLKDIDDWQRLCKTCHSLIDGYGFQVRTHCHAGHEYTLDSTYTRPNGFRECRICKTAYRRTWHKTNYVPHKPIKEPIE